MERLKSKKFWEAVLARAIWTLCETFISTTVGATLIEDLNWPFVISASLFAALISVAKSIVRGLPEFNED